VVGPVDGHDVAAVAPRWRRPRIRHQAHADHLQDHHRQGLPNRAGTAKAHGEPLGEAERSSSRASAGLAARALRDPRSRLRRLGRQGRRRRPPRPPGTQRFAAYRAAFPELAAELQRRMAASCRPTLRRQAVDAVLAAHTKAETVASRKASQMALEAFTKALPELLGGSADLTGSNLTNTASTPALRFDEAGQPNGGRHINYGVREFGMAAIMNGVALHGGFIPYGGTFLTFSDYSRNAIRMAALMKRASSTSSRTTASAWARTAPRTRAWSTPPACA
jgi:transketolase